MGVAATPGVLLLFLIAILAVHMLSVCVSLVAPPDMAPQRVIVRPPIAYIYF